MKEKSKNTFRMKKIILSVLLLCLLVFSAYCIHYILTTASFNGAQYYNIPKKETVVGSETFICGDSLQDFPGWTVVVSRDMERDNEVFILEYASPPAFDILHVLNPKYKTYLTATSGSDVGSLYFSVKDEDDRDLEYRYLLYYSSNKIEARKCVYTIRENDNVYEKTMKLQPYVAFGFLIPCGTNMDPDIKVIKASFYDKEGNLVYEDIRE